MEAFTGDEVAALVALVTEPWSWRVDDLPERLRSAPVPYRVERASRTLLDLCSDRLDPAGDALVDEGDVISLGFVLVERAEEGDEAGQAAVDAALAAARAVLEGAHGRPTGGKRPSWTVGEVRLALARTKTTALLQATNLANDARFQR